MELPLQLLDPSAVLPSFQGTGRPRLAEAGDRIPLPGIQLRQIQPLLAAPDTACRLIHCRCDDHCLQPRRCRPARAAGARSIGQGIRPPALQRRRAYPDLMRYMLHRRTLRRQQPRHYPIFVRLSVSSHFLLSAPPGFRSYLSGNSSDTGGFHAGLFDVAHQDLAVFQADHASSPSWKTAESLFDSTAVRLTVPMPAGSG
jgi:hypothetical protein